MPVIKTKSGGYKYGKTGKVYKSKSKDVKQEPSFGVVFCLIERSLNGRYNSLNADLTEVL